MKSWGIQPGPEIARGQLPTHCPRCDHQHDRLGIDERIVGFSTSHYAISNDFKAEEYPWILVYRCENCFKLWWRHCTIKFAEEIAEEQGWDV